MGKFSKSNFDATGSGTKPRTSMSNRGASSVLRSPTRPGADNKAVERAPRQATPGPVSRANGQVARPGFRQRKGGSPKGTSRIARPGGHEKIR